jgi:hypothetical protein
MSVDTSVDDAYNRMMTCHLAETGVRKFGLERGLEKKSNNED